MKVQSATLILLFPSKLLTRDVSIPNFRPYCSFPHESFTNGRLEAVLHFSVNDIVFTFLNLPALRDTVNGALLHGKE